jgi:hypothetical protein
MGNPTFGAPVKKNQMKKFAASLDALFSAEAETLNSNSADLLIEKFQTVEKETQHQSTNAGTKPGSRKRNTAPVDPAIACIPQGHSEGSEECAGSEGGSPC